MSLVDAKEALTMRAPKRRRQILLYRREKIWWIRIKQKEIMIR